ncbi:MULTISPECIES: hypothetical protein [unclassified Rhodococcus (in: high G+C Gram-positive bacteria)]|uniref:hypothetical protein n=1 Tax=unclassified Rhodococcus (in: high G+C Gram-positive bacteria) TaxID=192944 RepID=UPI0024B827B5|nr:MULTISPECIES: hypothetical protein [unclassified Rhodococcus (in: high G+C Gram-positive bacteria)]MDI9954927.1 hypothetical protein [Rhodococcus sp. IEGM 1237]MDI9960948.1 hypothetical protein [Rhodococcus sp. IEGM 1251]MDV8122992.1 hypothetical protein [Rhodococcus sp. IEGM 1304]
MSNDTAGILFVAGMIWLIFGIIAGVIAAKKNRSQLGFFLLGFCFGPLGILAAALVSPGLPPAPLGTNVAICVQCNAQQNVPSTELTYQCWQCKLVGPVHGRSGQNTTEKQNWKDWLKEGRTEH